VLGYLNGEKFFVKRCAVIRVSFA